MTTNIMEAFLRVTRRRGRGVPRLIAIALVCAAPALQFPGPAIAAPAIKPIKAEDLRPHIRTLASDAFEGREAGTDGQTKSVHYIAAQLSKSGALPGAPDGSWYQPFEVMHTIPNGADIAWRAAGKLVALPGGELMVAAPTPETSLSDTPIIFVGYGLEERGYQNLSGADLKGAVVLLQIVAPQPELHIDFNKVRRQLIERGAVAVIQVIPESFPWRILKAGWQKGSYVLAGRSNRIVEGAMPASSVKILLKAAGFSADLLQASEKKSFRAVPMNSTFGGSISTLVQPFTSYNVIGRLPGRGHNGEAVALTAHWDGLGLCRPEGERDRICNGAGDNASGVAAMLAIAQRLVKTPRSKRDTLFIATGAEEVGLLGAKAYVDAPSVPLHKLIAVLNMDMVAPVPAGKPLAIVGAGRTRLDPLIHAVAKDMKRLVQQSQEADSYANRLDSSAFLEKGVSAVTVQSLYGDPVARKEFIDTKYHRPNDEYSEDMDLEGAAGDATFNLALARALADPQRLQAAAPR